jgi:hypothetical protein
MIQQNISRSQHSQNQQSKKFSILFEKFAYLANLEKLFQTFIL